MYLIANWKQNLISEDIENWFQTFSNSESGTTIGDKVDVILCPSYVLIPQVSEKIKTFNLNVSLGSQDISEFDQGAHTGEVGAKQLKSYVKYTIIGHSERRFNGESNEAVLRKAKIALEHSIIPIICFSNLDELASIKESPIPFNKILLAYEPIESIGTGNPAPVTDLFEFYKKTGLEQMIYGGSVDKLKIQPYLELDFLNGFLVGGASLNPIEFKLMFDILNSRL